MDGTIDNKKTQNEVNFNIFTSALKERSHNSTQHFVMQVAEAMKINSNTRDQGQGGQLWNKYRRPTQTLHTKPLSTTVTVAIRKDFTSI